MDTLFLPKTVTWSEQCDLQSHNIMDTKFKISSFCGEHARTSVVDIADTTCWLLSHLKIQSNKQLMELQVTIPDPVVGDEC